jgi:hypothetical protein
MHPHKRGDDHVPRPATGKTPLRNIRVPNALWDAAKDKAAAEGRTLTDVLLAFLHRYVSTPAKSAEPTADEHPPPTT